MKLQECCGQSERNMKNKHETKIPQKPFTRNLHFPQVSQNRFLLGSYFPKKKKNLVAKSILWYSAHSLCKPAYHYIAIGVIRHLLISPPQRLLCVVGRLGRKKKEEGGEREKREERIRRHLEYIWWQRLPPFPPSHPPLYAFYFSIIAIFIVIHSGSLCRGGECTYCMSPKRTHPKSWLILLVQVYRIF